MEIIKYPFLVASSDGSFSGILRRITAQADYQETIKNGMRNGMTRGLINGEFQVSSSSGSNVNGYSLTYAKTGDIFAVYDMGDLIELRSWDKHGNLIHYEGFGVNTADLVVKKILDESTSTVKLINELKNESLHSSLVDTLPCFYGSKEEKEKALRVLWAYERDRRWTEGEYNEKEDFLPFFKEQEYIRKQIVKENPDRYHVTKVAGADVAYNELEQRMVGALVVLDAQTLEVVDQATHEMEITFPYVPGLFSFREVPPLIEAYKKLKVKPDLIVCDGHGIAHPKGAGMASHLGVELDIPTIGCAKSRLVGVYKEVSQKRGSFSSLILEENEIGRVLRTQDNIKPMFVSVGHKVSLDTACEWVLKLSPKYRQPETTRQADALVRTIMKERTDIGYPEE